MKPRRLTPIADRFWPKVRKTTTCWLWIGARVGPYGVIHRGRANEGRVYAHRVSWEIAHKQPIPAGKVIDHLCEQQLCVRPSHLEVVSNAENTTRTSVRYRAQGVCRYGHRAGFYLQPNGHIGYCRACHRLSAKDRAGLRRGA